MCGGPGRSSAHIGSECDQNSQSKSVSVGPAPQDSRPLLRFRLLLSSDGFLDLGKFEEDQLVLSITISMVVDKELECFLVSSFPYQETWCFGYELDGYKEV